MSDILSIEKKQKLVAKIQKWANDPEFWKLAKGEGEHFRKLYDLGVSDSTDDLQIVVLAVMGSMIAEPEKWTPEYISEADHLPEEFRKMLLKSLE